MKTILTLFITVLALSLVPTANAAVNGQHHAQKIAKHSGKHHHAHHARAHHHRHA
jgi:hypothetical protein